MDKNFYRIDQKPKLDLNVDELSVDVKITPKPAA